MPIGAGEGLVGLPVHRQRRCDVEQDQPRYRLWMVDRQPMRDPRAAIVGKQVEAIETELCASG